MPPQRTSGSGRQSSSCQRVPRMRPRGGRDRGHPCPCPPGYHQPPGSERKRAAVSQFHVSVSGRSSAPCGRMASRCTTSPCWLSRRPVRRRLGRRSLGTEVKRGSWAAGHLGEHLQRLGAPEFAGHIRTDRLTVAQVADAVASSAGRSGRLLTARCEPRRAGMRRPSVISGSTDPAATDLAVQVQQRPAAWAGRLWPASGSGRGWRHAGAGC